MTAVETETVPISADAEPHTVVLPELVEPQPILISKTGKRVAEGDLQYEGCCDVPFKMRARNPLAGKEFKKNTVLQGLLQMHQGQKPEQLQKILCAYNFHVTRKEITNYCCRQKNN